ncbi:Protein YIF1B-A [Camellia lanceoleosa]|uniref:Protein YIF1B-A n=1 Tax=Camellia lanceoleosa TaxID=1840588 RepID=A0ACC0F358_9ERIC|nr:Protein YIF1B-A [Camellia lanceoleosa]
MYDNLGAQPGVQRPPPNPQPNPFGDAFVGAGSGLIRGGLGAYGERILGSSSEYVQSNISRYFSDPQYYFQVNDQYVRNKLKVVLFPFLHRGHWTRITEPVGGRLSYKPPIYDINAPDLYIPLMAFGTYVVLAGFSLGLQGKFSPEALNWLFIKGLVGWFLQVTLLKMSLFSLGSGEAPLLDIVAYAGYSFTGMCLAVLGRIVWSYSYYFLMPWTCLCMGIYLVKTMKRVLFAENQTELVQQIVKASQEFGFFQLINHGVPEGLVQDVMRVAKELFELPADDNASLYSEDPKKSCRLYMSIDCVHEKVLFWRDTLRFHCHPLDDYVEDWPRNPARYRSV